MFLLVCSSDGAPLSLSEIMKSALLRPHTLSGAELSSFGLADPGSSFPLLSQGDHPILGSPSWYLHPCHTAEVVQEIMAELQQDEWSDEYRLLRWMEAWFMVLEQVVNLRAGGA